MNLLDITLKWWWVLALLPLPFVLRYVTGYRGNQSSAEGALNVPFFERLSAQFGTTQRTEKTLWWQWLLLTLSWCLLVLALCRPTWVGEKIPLPVAGRDIMLAVDLSGSMDERDLGTRGNRLDVVKATADAFIQRRVGDRVGLIFFSDRAYLQAPLTFDREVVRELLDEANVGLTGQRTAIGDAIAIGLKRLRESFAQTPTTTHDKHQSRHDSQVLILLTDGANNAGVTEPQQATAIAKKLGIKIYTIGVGGKGRVVNTVFGKQLLQTSDLDEPALQAIAKATGGRYFRATDPDELEAIYQAIDQLEPIDRDPDFLRPELALYYYPALLSLLCFALLLGLASIKNHLSFTLGLRGN